MIGNSVYSVGVQFLIIVAVKKILGDSVDVVVEHSMDKGIYCEIKGSPIDAKTLDKVEEKMHEMAQNDYKFIKLGVSRMDAINYFKKKESTR